MKEDYRKCKYSENRLHNADFTAAIFKNGCFTRANIHVSANILPFKKVKTTKKK